MGKTATGVRLAGRAQGFTLVELMLAVALVAVLAAVALPTMSAYRERALDAQAATEIAGIAVRLRQFAEDNHRFPESLAEAGIAAPPDPWGGTYQYLLIDGKKGKGWVRKDKKFNPINSDFDLYSAGADGQTHTQLDNKLSVDDVVRARDGAFIGLARDF